MDKGIRCGKLDFRAVDANSKQFELSFSSEEPYVRYGMAEILSHDEDAVDLSRFENGTATVLFSHGRDPNYGRVPIGKVVRAWVDAETRKCRAVIEMDDDDDSKRLHVKLEKGMLTGVSVGYTVSEWTEIKAGSKSGNGRFAGPAVVATRWEPLEISLEPTPADASVGYGRAINDNEEEKRTMEFEVKTADVSAPAVVAAPPAIPASVPTPDTKGAEKAATNAERTRVMEIGSLCRNFDLDASEFIEKGVSLEKVREQVLEKMAESKQPAHPAVGVQRDEMDKVRSAAVDGLLMRSGVAVVTPADGAREFQGMSLRDIAAECLSRSGESNVLRMSKDELFKRSMSPDSAFVSIMADMANKVVLDAYAAAPTTFQLWTGKGTATDFRPTEYYEISDSGTLDEIPQNGEIKEGKLGDTPVATRRLITLGKKISFTRQMFVNDDVDMINRTLATYIMSFARGTNKSVYDILKRNPMMRDGQRLFSDEHNNLCTAAAPGTEAFSEARKKMRNQKDGDTTLNLTPAFVLSGSSEETPIEILLASLADPSGANSNVANIFRGKMTLITDAELDVGNGPNPYYFASDFRLAPTIEVAYLNGNESPIVESRAEFDRLGMSFRIFGDRAITLLGYRGFVKNPGAVKK